MRAMKTARDKRRLLYSFFGDGIEEDGKESAREFVGGRHTLPCELLSVFSLFRAARL